MFKLPKSLMAGLALGCLALAPAQAQTVWDPSTPAEIEAQLKAGDALRASFAEAMKSGKKEFKVPTATYRFNAGFDIEKLEGVVFDGQGSTFIFKFGSGGLNAKSCVNTAVKNLFMDLDQAPYTQGTVVAADNERRTVDVKIDRGYLLESPLKPNSSLRCMFFDASGNRELPAPDAFAPAEKISADVIRLKLHNAFNAPKGTIAPGCRMAASFFFSGGSGGGIGIRGCSGCLFENIVIYSAGGFAINEGDICEGGNTYKGLKLIRKPNTGRLIAGASDAFHSLHQRKGPSLINCELSYAFDDLINIHGFFSMVIERRSPRDLVIAGPFEKDFGTGSELKFYKSPYALPIGQAKVVECTRLEKPNAKEVEAKANAFYSAISKEHPVRSFPGSQPCLVKLDRDIELAEFDIVSTSDYVSRGAVVEGCKLHDGHIRGILLKCPDGVIKNNVIDRIAYSGIILQAEQYWLEGPFPDNVRIIDNVISNCGASSSRLGAIELLSDFGNPRGRFPAASTISNVEISGNKIINAAKIAIIVANSDGVKINRNLIVAPFSQAEKLDVLNFKDSMPNGFEMDDKTRAIMEKPYYAIFCISSKNVSGSGNTLERAPAILKGLAGAGACTENINVK